MKKSDAVYFVNVAAFIMFVSALMFGESISIAGKVLLISGLTAMAVAQFLFDFQARKELLRAKYNQEKTPIQQKTDKAYLYAGIFYPLMQAVFAVGLAFVKTAEYDLVRWIFFVGAILFALLTAALVVVAKMSTSILNRTVEENGEKC